MYNEKIKLKKEEIVKITNNNKIEHKCQTEMMEILLSDKINGETKRKFLKYYLFADKKILEELISLIKDKKIKEIISFNLSVKTLLNESILDNIIKELKQCKKIECVEIIEDALIEIPIKQLIQIINRIKESWLKVLLDDFDNIYSIFLKKYDKKDIEQLIKNVDWVKFSYPYIKKIYKEKIIKQFKDQLLFFHSINPNLKIIIEWIENKNTLNYIYDNLNNISELKDKIFYQWYLFKKEEIE